MDMLITQWGLKKQKHNGDLKNNKQTNRTGLVLCPILLQPKKTIKQQTKPNTYGLFVEQR